MSFYPVRISQSLFLSLCGVLIGLMLASPVGAQFVPSVGTSASDSATTDAPAADDPLAPLLDVLRDDVARARLIAELEKTVPADADPTAESAAAAEAAPAQLSFGGRVALLTQGIVESTVAEATQVIAAFGQTGSVFSGLHGNELPVLFDAFKSLLLVIAITVAVFLTLRTMAIPLFRSLGQRASARGLSAKVGLFIASVLIDLMIVLVAWAIGYGVTTFALGEFGQIDLRQTLYLNAFVLVEAIKVAVRAVLSPSAGGLRILPIGNRAAKSLNRATNIVVSVLGYGQLLIVPIVNQNASFAAGLGVSALLSVLVLLYLIVLVLQQRKAVTAWLTDRFADPVLVADADGQLSEADPDAPPPNRKLHGFVGGIMMHWHWLALVYLAFMFIAVMSQPTEVVFGYLAASGKILLAVLIASLITGALSSSMRNGVVLPDDVMQRLPLLQPRLNRIVPKILLVVRMFVALLVVLFAFDTLGLIGLRGWMESQFGQNLTGAIVSVFLTLLVAYGIWIAMISWVDYRLNPDYGKVPTARETTLLSLLRNAATIALIVLTLMFVLSEIGLNIGPLLASAGVLGLAIGFGAQKMVQDIITGVFIQFENAINVGDVITVGGITGGVEKLTVRSVSLRDVNGVFHIIPFSSVDMVSNFTREFSYFVCDMGVAYRENVDEVKEAMHQGFDELRAIPEQGAVILGDMEWFGLNSFGDSAVVLRSRIKTLPGKQWGLGRAYNEILKRIFDERGIEIPFPHQTIFFGEAKDGTTQPITITQQTPPRVEKEPEQPVTPPRTDHDEGKIDLSTTDAPEDDD
ncbi:mechanosensitive ion channel domain-containing protein [Puniceibacterium sp. IMCC21224]|uniref:mechanosensitive ion channel domain-containing protein n=1 Tax=Puniceibacterium sp. IMCC21224 TaxID=1618204 RepID=UPI00065D03C4|nr:mechanosensitive ion channel domain-containing protein [Puniceibacterium sp. IMCC21224]KMK65636.1 small-conductance mechanosensitive channel [Puniceibacterium sp. IMCC21224]